MKRVLLLATTTGYQIRSFGEAAEKVGVRLVFASDRCDQLEDPWWDQAIPVRFHEAAQSIQAVVQRFADTPPAGIVAVGDRPAVLASHLASVFGLPGHPPAAAAISRNKLLTRQALRDAGLPTPWFELVSIDAAAAPLATRVPYPAVIKPLALAGSRGVMRVNDTAEFVAAFARLRALLQLPDVRIEREDAHEYALIESFVPGSEYAIEGLLERGEMRVLAIFDKPDPLDGPFFEETIYATPSSTDAIVQRRIVEAVMAAVRGIGLRHGPIHAECRVNGDGVHVLEVAARPIGGLCARALRFRRQTDAVARTTRPADEDDGRTMSLEEVLLRHAIGDTVSDVVREDSASGVMMIPIPKRGVYRGVDGVDDARAVGGIEDIRITAKPETALVPLPEGKSYLGFIFSRGSTARDVVRALRDAHARLRFSIDREVAVVG